MIPIKLVFRLIFDKKLRNFVTLTWLYWKSVSVRLNEQRTTDPGSRLVDPVDDEDVEEIVHELILQLWQCDLKKNGRILTLIQSIDHHFTYFTLAW